MSTDRLDNEGRQDLPTGRPVRVHRSPPLMGGAGNSHSVVYPSSYLQNKRQVHPGYHRMPKPDRHPQWGEPHMHQYHSSYPTTSQPHQHFKSVVTSSFSADDEKQDHFQGKESHAMPAFDPPSRLYSVKRALSFSSTSREEEDRNPRSEDVYDERQVPGEEREDVRREHVPPSRDGPNLVTIPPSPPEVAAETRRVGPLGSNKPTSTHSVKPPENLKRNFWHHSSPGEHCPPSNHPAFAPPKRAKLSDRPRKEHVTLTARTPAEDQQQTGWYRRSYSWGAQEEHLTYRRQVRKTQSFPVSLEGKPPRPSSHNGFCDNAEDEYGDAWATPPEEAPPHAYSEHLPPHFRGSYHHDRFPHGPPQPAYGSSHSGEARHGSFDRRDGRVAWRNPQGHTWGPQVTPLYSQGISRSWSGPSQVALGRQSRDDVEVSSRTSPRDSHFEVRDLGGERSVLRQVTFESSGGDNEALHYPQVVEFSRTSGLSRRDGLVQYTPSPTDTFSGASMAMRSMSADIYDNDERLGQGKVQLLCLLAQPEDRISLSETLCTIRENIEVFTATASDVEAPAPGRKHPVVVGQVGLRCIHCRHTTKSSDRVKRAVCYPSSIRRIYRTVIDMKLDHFQHCPFVPAALKSRLNELKATNTRSTGTTMQYFVKAAKKMRMIDGPSGVRLSNGTEGASASDKSPVGNEYTPALSPTDKRSSPSTGSYSAENRVSPMEEEALSSPEGKEAGQKHSVVSVEDSFESPSGQEDNHTTGFTGKVVLALPEDKMALSPLRCFLRENVCAFSATEEDIAVRTPTTFSVVLGQVGIGCIHCHSLPAKERSNRAVCFPFAIGRIYQSVADIQRFHLAECKMVPHEVRERFLSLASASSKGSKGLATRQYWVTSARKIGLTDTPQGIRFGRDPSIPSAPAVSLDILAQVASNVTTASKPLVLPEDKPYIAEFLYVVMAQLQPCRFTEADRNKRRLRDMGCIGVECKHCAGQVESRKFFWSTVNAVESNFVSVHTHMMECRFVPDALKARLAELKLLRKEQTSQLRTGSQKAFFRRVWNRLHGKNEPSKLQKASSTDSESSKKVELVSDGLENMNVVSV